MDREPAGCRLGCYFFSRLSRFFSSSSSPCWPLRRKHADSSTETPTSTGLTKIGRAPRCPRTANNRRFRRRFAQL